MNIANADNSDKNHRSQKLNTVETKMKSLGIPIMAYLNPNQTLIRFKPSGSIMKKKYKMKDPVQNAGNKLRKIVCKWQDIIRYYIIYFRSQGKKENYITYESISSILTL